MLAGVALPAGAAPARFHVAFTIRDPRIDEASGLALGVRSPGVAYLQNDSGDTARFFAVDARTGRTAATITVRGARNVDWEDLAVAPSASGLPSVWLADIGDNDGVRDEVDVYRVPEPRVRPAGRDVSISTGRAAVWRLRYPDGPVDAESLAVTPSGVGYIVTKSPGGHSQVYRLPPHPDRHAVQEVIPVAGVEFPDAVSFGRLATGAAISADGRWLAIRTYLAAYLWRLGRDGVGGALSRPGRPLDLPLQLQGEGIAFRDGRIYLDSEGRRSAVYVAVYAPLTARPSSPSASATSPVSSAARSGAGPPNSRQRHDGWIGKWALAIAAIVVLGAAVEYRRRGGGRNG